MHSNSSPEQTSTADTAVATDVESATDSNANLPLATPQPGSGHAALVGWLGIAAGAWGVWSGSDQGWMSANAAAFFAQGIGGLVAVVAGVVVTKRKRLIQGPCLVLLGLILMAAPVLLIFAIGAAFSSMAQGG